MKDMVYHNIRKYFFNTTWLLLEKVTGTALIFLVTIYLARYLKPANFGLFSYLLSITGFLLPIATLGMEQIIIKYLAPANDDRCSVILGTAFFLRTIGSFCAIVVILLGLVFGIIDSSVNLYVVIVGMGFFFQAFNVIELYFQSKVLSKYVVIAQLTANFISAAIKFICIVLKMNFEVFVILVLVDDILLSLSYVYVYLKHKFSLFKWRFDKYIAKEFIQASWPIMLCGFSVVIYMRVDQVMLKNMLNSTAVGYYAAASRICEIWYTIPTIIMYSIYPYFIGIRQDRKRYFDSLQVFYEFSILISVIILIFLAVFSQDIIRLLYGPAYARAGSILGVIVFVMPVAFFSIVRLPWIILENRQAAFSLYSFLGLVANILLNFLFIPIFKEFGAVFATIITQLLVNIALPLLNKNDRSSVLMFLKSFSQLSLIRFIKERKLLTLPLFNKINHKN